jgi:hypothetical protein
MADDVRTFPKHRRYVLRVLLKIRPHRRRRAIAVTAAIDNFQPPMLSERALLSPGQGAIIDATMHQHHAQAGASNHDVERHHQVPYLQKTNDCLALGILAMLHSK